MSLSACVLAACSTPPPALSRADALDAHRKAAAAWLADTQAEPIPAIRRPAPPREETTLPRITAHVAGEPLSALAELLVLDAGLSLSYPPELAETPVYVAWEDREALPALKALAQQLGLVAAVRGEKEVELSPERATDVEVIALSAPYNEASDVKNFVERLISKVGGAEAVGQTVIVADIPDRIGKFEALADVLSAPRSQWLVEAKFIEIASGWERRLGAEFRASGALNATFSAEDLLDPVRGGALLVELLAEASAGSTDARMVATTRVHCIDGRTAKSDYGQRTPVPRRSVSDQGTVTTVGYDIIETGVILDVAVRELPDGSALLSVIPEVSSVTGYIDDAPIVSQSRVEVEGIVPSGGVLLVGGLDTRSSSSEVGGGAGTAFGLRERRDSEDRSVVVVLRAERVRPKQ